MDRTDALQPSSDWRARNYRRFDLEFPVLLRFQTGSTSLEVEGVSKNVSVGGLLVRSVSPIPPHTSVTFVLSVHGKHALRPVRLFGEGEIVRMEPEEHQTSFVLAVKCISLVKELENYLPQ
jgi:hypothetical protein